MPENVEEVRGICSRPLNLKGNSSDNVISGASGNDIMSGGAGADDFLLYFDMGNDVVKDFSFSNGDEVVTAFGLKETDYEILETTEGFLFSLSDGSSLLLSQEIVA